MRSSTATGTNNIHKQQQQVCRQVNRTATNTTGTIYINKSSYNNYLTTTTVPPNCNNNSDNNYYRTTGAFGIYNNKDKQDCLQQHQTNS